MKRRLFVFLLTLLVGNLLLSTMLVEASSNDPQLKPDNFQPEPGRVYRIAVSQFVEHPALDQARLGFIDRLAEYGIDQDNHHNLDLEVHFAQADQSNTSTIARQIKASHPDLALAIATPSAQALAKQVDDFPILFTAVTDPVEAKLVSDPDHPGANITGSVDRAPIADQLKLLLELAPQTKSVAVLYTASEINSELQAREVQTLAEGMGLTAESLTVSSSNEIQQVALAAAGKFDAIYTPTDNLIASAMTTVAQAAKQFKVPIIAAEEGHLAGGALATIGIDYYKLGRLTADMAVEILSGKPIAQVPVRQLEDLTIKINLDAARANQLLLPREVLGHSSEEVCVSFSGLTPEASDFREEAVDKQTAAGPEKPDFKSRLLVIIAGSLTQGLLWGIMALGVYISFRLLDFADMTVDGSFAMGGVITASLLLKNFSPLLALLLALTGGMLAGLATGILHTKMKIPQILAGILSQLALYSINLRLASGKPNIPLLTTNTLFNHLNHLLGESLWANFAVSLVIASILVGFLYWFFGTEIGTMVRATGGNPNVVRSLGMNTDLTIMLGLILSNGLIALSGGLVAQDQGYADVGMGQGAIVIGLAAIIIGEVLLANRNFWLRFNSVLIGAIIYRLTLALVIELGLNPSDLKLFTALIVALALFIPELQDKLQSRRTRAGHKEA